MRQEREEKFVQIVEGVCNMTLVKTTFVEKFDEQDEINRINSYFDDDHELRDLLLEMVKYFCDGEFDFCQHLVEILNGHSDRNPLEYASMEILSWLNSLWNPNRIIEIVK